MNAPFELPQAGVVDRRNPNVGVGSPKAFAIAEKLSEVGALKTTGRALSSCAFGRGGNVLREEDGFLARAISGQSMLG